MIYRPLVQLASTAALLLTGFAQASCADEQAQVLLMESVAEQFEELNSAADELAKLLEGIKDAQSADDAISKLESANSEVISQLGATSSALQRGMMSTGGTIASPQYKARADAVAQKQPGIVQEWKQHTARYAKEIARVQQVPNLSARFRSSLQKQNIQLRGAVAQNMGGLGGTAGIPNVGVAPPPSPTTSGTPSNSPARAARALVLPPNVELANSYDELVAQFGKNRVARVEIANFTEFAPRAEDVATVIVSATKRDEPPASGKPNELIRFNLDASRGVVALGPVDDFDGFCKRLELGEIQEQKAADRIVKIKIAPAKFMTSMAVAGLSNPAEKAQVGKMIEEAMRDVGFASGPGNAPNFSGGVGDLPATSDPDYHKKLAERMLNSADFLTKSQAIDALLAIRPEDVKDASVRKQIAVNFRTLAQGDIRPDNRGKAIRGLILYGGKYSTPVLVEILNKEAMEAPPELFKGFVQYPDAKGAEAVGKQVGSFFNGREALRTLTQMGSVAEDALIAVAPSDDPEISLAAVNALGKVGTKKSLPLLSKAARSSNSAVSSAAKEASKAIAERSRQPPQSESSR